MRSHNNFFNDRSSFFFQQQEKPKNKWTENLSVILICQSIGEK